MSNHDLRYLRSNGVEELYRSILPPGVSPSHVPVSLLNQLTAAAAAASSQTTVGLGVAPPPPPLPPVSLPLPPPPPTTTPLLPSTAGSVKSSAKQSKADLEKQLLLQQQQLLHLNAVYAQYFQGLATASPEIGQLRGTNHLSPDQFLSAIQAPSNSQTYGPSLVDMRRLLLVQNEKIMQQQKDHKKTDTMFKGAGGSAFTPVTPKQKALNRLPVPKGRSASVPLQATSNAQAKTTAPWDGSPPQSQLHLDDKKIKSEVPKPPPTLPSAPTNESLVKTPEIVQKDVAESKSIVEVVQVNEADSITSPNPKPVKEEIIVVDQPQQQQTAESHQHVEQVEETAKVVVTSSKDPESPETNSNNRNNANTPDKEEELQSKEVSSSNIPVVSPKPTINQLPHQMQPLKKRRLKAVIADALNQNVDESFSSNYSSRNISPIQAINGSDSDTLPLAVIRDKLNQSQTIAKSTTTATTSTVITPMKLRAEDHITDIESSLATFKSHVSTPKSSTPSSPTSRPESHGPHGKSPLATPEKRTGSSRRKVREPSASLPAAATPVVVVAPEVTYSTMDASEMNQLAPYIISGSDSDNTIESSGDDFHSRVYIDASERRKTRSPGQMAKPKKKVVGKKPGRKGTSGKKKWKSEDEDDDDHLAKFFAADAELNAASVVENKVAIVSAQPKPKQPKKRKSDESSKSSSQSANRKRKSGTPRKLEVIDEKQLDTWETAKETEVVKNSSNGKDYLIKEHDASWYSVTCFCGQPFAGRPMIECDLCGMWVHMTCAKIKKNKVPDNYNCTQCRRDAKAVKTRQRR